MTIHDEVFYRAATARGEGIGATGRASRPSKRRCAEDSTAPARAAGTLRSLDLRESPTAGGSMTFDGMATVYEAPYEMYDYWGPYTEVVTAGAGAECLNRADLDVPLVLQHADLRRIARTTNGSLTLTETDDGLHVLAPALDMADQDVAYIVPKLRAGLVDEMSFKFMITCGTWSPDYTEYRIQSYDIHRGDVAIVGYGANPATMGTMRHGGDLAALVRNLSPRERGDVARLIARERVEPVPLAQTSGAPGERAAQTPTGRSVGVARALIELGV